MRAGQPNGHSNHSAYLGIRTLVVGGSGFIGRWLVRALSSWGAVVHVTARDEVGARAFLARHSILATVISADLSQRHVIGPLIDRVSPAIVFNLAVHGVDRDERDPVLMTALNERLAIDVCDRLAGLSGGGWSGLRLVQLGTAAEYGEVTGRIREDMEGRPTTDYGRTKLVATTEIARRSQESGLRSVVARLFTVYGAGEHAGRLLPALEDVAKTRTPLRLTAGTQRRDFTYVGDVVEGLLRLGVSGAAPGTIVNVATGQLTSVRTFAETAAAVMGFEPALLEFGAMSTRIEEMSHDEVDVSRLEKLTGWRPPTSVAEGIRQSWERHRADQ